ncbi:MAG TPA: hypothetical protein VGN36_04845 [Sphingorhabdus sp.]|nr:hypothetical protein [Sphingorhabdus sp.]
MFMTFAALALTLQATGTAPATEPTASTDKVVCKKFEVTGSLVKKKRVCHRQSEWARINQRDNDAARKYVQDHAGAGGSSN